MEFQQTLHNHSNGGSSSCFTTLPDSLWNNLQMRVMLNGTDFPHDWEDLWYYETKYSRETPIITWEQLSQDCQIEQIFLLVVAVLVTIITVIGNVFILMVIVSTGLVYQDTFLIRTALAIADLLLGLMPAALAVFDHMTLMSGTTTLAHLLPKTFWPGLAHESSAKMQLEFHLLRFERGGYPLACAIVLTLSMSFSMFILALLSIERLCVVFGKPLRRSSIVLGLALAFVVSLLISLMLNWCHDHRAFTGYFDPVTKLTLGLRRHDQQARENLTIHSAHRVPEMRRLTETLTYMVLLFTLSCVPCILDIATDLRWPVGHHLAWWTFMAGSSWNWALYTLRGEKFWRHAKGLFGDAAHAHRPHIRLKSRKTKILFSEANAQDSGQYNECMSASFSGQ
ncbi:hypothetical protein C7M84_021599 [Penaeus vannamei]|uniref:G-protein coupled receptors family 1 profile domain-containing protein n=1 Tax=Penaeus vannamei TaxID=6689 RepID=A0A423S997_PENVA|nr:hypothetical protein C7M84_021599 [Penaeus vannamei]